MARSRSTDQAGSSGLSLEKFRQFVYEFPNQMAVGLEAVHAVSVPRQQYSRVVVCGMGGSALAADLANAWLDLNPDIFIHRTFDLPNEADGEALVVVMSHSGNTAETLSAFDAAVQQQKTVVAITTGGELAVRAKKNNIPLVLLPQTEAPPRISTGQQLAALAIILAKAGIIEDPEEALVDAATEIAQDRTLEERGEGLAAAIDVRLPLIYTSAKNAVLARNWKIKLNETAKRAAFWNVLPEASHNELCALSDGADYFYLVTLVDPDDDEREKKYFSITEEMSRELKWPVKRVELKGTSRLAKILHTAWLGDWFALKLAERLGNDPAATPLIETFKKKAQG